MKKIEVLIEQNGLRPTDAIVLRKRFLGMVDHYVLFMGYHPETFRPLFIANYGKGIKVVPEGEILNYLEVLEPERIDYFPGNESERDNAVRRALERNGEMAYSYVANNCEHFKNWVHFGENYSSQVDKAGDIAIGAGAALAIGGLVSKNKTAAYVGAGALLLGALLKYAADDNKKQS